MCGLHRHRIHHRIDGHARQSFLLLQGNAKTVESVEQLRIHLVEAAGSSFGARCCIVAYILEINLGDTQMRPARHCQGAPMAVSLKTEVQQPLRLTFLCRYQAHDLLAQSAGNDVGVDVGREAILVLRRSGIIYYLAVFVFLFHYIYVFSRGLFLPKV